MTFREADLKTASGTGASADERTGQETPKRVSGVHLCSDASSGATLESTRLFGGSITGLTARDVDWSGTPLGPIEHWSPALRTTVGTLFHARHPMLLWWGPELIQLYNDGYLSVFGAGGLHPGAMGQRGAECWPAVWPIIHPQIRDVMERGVASWNEDQMVPVYRNGRMEEAYWTYGYSPVRELDGTIAGTLVVCQETTRAVLEQRASDAAALAEMRRLGQREERRILAEAIPQQVWTAGPDGVVDFVSQRVLDYLGASSRVVLAHGWSPVVHPADEAARHAKWAHALSTGEPYECEHRLRRADGSYRWHLTRAIALRDEAGTLDKWFGTNTDIDDAKLIHDELRMRTETEQYLVGIVSHDLRTPIQAILLGAETLALLDALPERSVRIVRRIEAAARRSARMIHDLLDFTQARMGGGISIRRSETDLHLVASQVAEEVSAAHPRSALVVRHEGDATGRWDGDRLAQALANLLHNAIQHGAPEGAVTLATRGEGDQVVVEVHNGGAPIATEALGSIFHPMRRAAGVAERSTRSIGLGLYIVHEVVRGHGGTIDVRSASGEGTTFSLRLPRALPTTELPST